MERTTGGCRYSAVQVAHQQADALGFLPKDPADGSLVEVCLHAFKYCPHVAPLECNIQLLNQIPAPSR
eukprot:m.368992 g.368992  ORF g.368992 m.368992 type:complete len:68 (+) comp20845_c0_seq17:929-1132(+)